jgi:cysteine desulfurase
MPVYLDHNATTPLLPAALAAMQEVLAAPTNASSVHSFGREAKKRLEAARKTIAEKVSAWPNELVFMGSGTEANITALRGTGAARVLVSAVEHSSVLKARADVQSVPVLENGIIDLAALEAILAQSSEPTLLSLMLANNETGVIQHVFEASQLCRKHGALLHCDAVQGLGKIAVDFGALGADMMTLSAHKCGGPVGAAALVVRRELPFAPLLTGGGQESGRRAGTENVAAICGFAAAVAHAWDTATLAQWRDAMEATLSAHGAVIFGQNTPRLPGTSCVTMPAVSNEVQLMNLDLAGFAVSAGSACSSGRIEVSHVLTAMGATRELAASAIRVSGGWSTTEAEMKAFAQQWIGLKSRLHAPMAS